MAHEMNIYYGILSSVMFVKWQWKFLNESICVVLCVYKIYKGENFFEINLCAFVQHTWLHDMSHSIHGDSVFAKAFGFYPRKKYDI